MCQRLRDGEGVRSEEITGLQSPVPSRKAEWGCAQTDPLQYDSFADEYQNHAVIAAYNDGYGPVFYTGALLERGAEVVGCDASPAMIELVADSMSFSNRIPIARMGEYLAVRFQSGDSK